MKTSNMGNPYTKDEIRSGMIRMFIFGVTLGSGLTAILVLLFK